MQRGGGMKYIKLYFDEWALSTRMLTTEEKGAWVELIPALCANDTPGELTVNKRSLARLWGFRASKTAAVLESLKASNLITCELSGDNFVLKSEHITNKIVHQNRLEKAAKFAVSVRESTKIQENRSEKPDRNAIPKDKRLNTKSTTCTKKKEAKALPTLEEVLSFCEKRRIPSSTGEAFYNYYEGHNLWLNKNKEPIKWWFVIQNEPWKSNHEHNSINRNGSLRSISRNTGTANETDGSEYAEVGRVVRN